MCSAKFAMDRNLANALLSLLAYLDQENIGFARVYEDELKDKAVVKFSLDLGLTPQILCGPFFENHTGSSGLK